VKLEELSKELHVFEGEDDWIVAYSPEDAWVVWETHTLSSRSDLGVADEDTGYWIQLPDDKLMTIRTDEDAKDENEGFLEKTCADWAKFNGRGYFCGVDY
jgi:hypothetical protein